MNIWLWISVNLHHKNGCTNGRSMADIPIISYQLLIASTNRAHCRPLLLPGCGTSPTLANHQTSWAIYTIAMLKYQRVNHQYSRKIPLIFHQYSVAWYSINTPLILHQCPTSIPRIFHSYSIISSLNHHLWWLNPNLEKFGAECSHASWENLHRLNIVVSPQRHFCFSPWVTVNSWSKEI